jgi:hypothetical protein
MRNTWSILSLALILALPFVVTTQACDDDPQPVDGDADSDSDSDSDSDVDVDVDVDGDSDADDSCTTTGPFCSDDATQVLACAGGIERVIQTCPADQVCSAGACGVLACEPGTVECPDITSERRCSDTGFEWRETPCDEEDRCTEVGDNPGCGEVCVLRVFILLDQSGSMGGAADPNKWEQARRALETLMASEAAQEVEFGLGVFPSGGDCGTGSQIIYPIPEATAESVNDYFTSNTPTGHTPLLDALELHTTDTAANLNDPLYSNFILVVSDGADTCLQETCVEGCAEGDADCVARCEANSEAEVISQAGTVTTRLRVEQSIRTFVIGFGFGVSDAQLTAIAENGGTELGRWLAANNVTELSAAFDIVLDEMLECNPMIY